MAKSNYPPVIEAGHQRIIDILEGVYGEGGQDGQEGQESKPGATMQRLVASLEDIAAAHLAEAREKFETVEPNDVNFYDYDGTLYKSYSKDEFLGLPVMPANPYHEGLRAQGWNWTLSGAQAYVEKYGAIEIGQSYVTEDGRTKVYIDIAETERMSISIQFLQSVANGVTVDWGDGSETETAEGSGNTAIKMNHTYAAEGKYIVSLSAADGCEVMLGSSTKNDTTVEGVSSQQQSFIFSQYMGGRSPVVGLEIGKGVTRIGNSALLWCNRLEFITIPNTVTAIYQLAFCGCTKACSIVVPRGCTMAGPFVFRGCQAATVIPLPEGLTGLGVAAFSGCVSLLRVSVPEGVLAIGNNSFAHCFALEKVIFPDTVASIGIECFKNCYTLREMHLPAGIKEVPDGCFQGCHALTGVEIPEGVTTIGVQAFTSCYSIGYITIPSTVTQIKQFAFLYGDGAKEFHVKATTPPQLEPTAFTSTFVDYIIYVPQGTLDAYINATGWASKAEFIQEEVGA